MNKITYSFSEIDCFEFPQKYQLSTYYGIDFLLIYKKTRNKIIEQIKTNNERIETPIDENSKFYDEYLKIIKKKTFETKKLLCFIYKKFLENKLNDEYLELINKLIKKFEISKKIFDVYEFDLTSKSKNFMIYKNYLILSLICIKLYEKKMNLKFLNTSLKLNDALCSNFKKIIDKNDLLLLKKVLELELNAIDNLMRKKGLEKI